MRKFGDDRSKFRHTLSDFCCENGRKIRCDRLNLTLLSERMAELPGIKVGEFFTRADLMICASLVTIAASSGSL